MSRAQPKPSLTDEHARRIARKSDTTLRFTRALLVHPIKKQMLELLGPGLAYEGLAALGR